MAMNSKNLSVLAYSNGFTLWHYKTEDLKTAVSAAGYFNSVSNIFNQGDLIVASMDTDGTLASSIFVVSSNVNGVVTIADSLTA